MDINVMTLFEERLKMKYNFQFALKNEQIEVINGVLKKQDVSCLLPTGFGKSMCYILPPLIMDEVDEENKHLAVVISPLLSLMEDQRLNLEKHGIKAICVTHETQKSDIIDLYKADASVIFTSPESLRSSSWRRVLLNTTFQKRVCLLACDEAHCISEWGENFRPEFREIAAVRSLIDVPVLALTATATEKVHKDIFEYLLLGENTVRVAVIPDRPNIFVDIRTCKDDYTTELLWFSEYVKTDEQIKKTIIFCRSYDATYNIRSWLVMGMGENVYVDQEKKARKRKIEMFHSSTDQETKDWIMADFTKVDSNIRVLVCTVAFGMGIEIPDVEIIIHWGSAKSVLSYWQEVGRSGRDGRLALGVMLAYGRSLMKSVTNEVMKDVVNCKSCYRRVVLENLLTDSMTRDKLPVSSACENKTCDICECISCMCCANCFSLCECKGKMAAVDRFINM